MKNATFIKGVRFLIIALFITFNIQISDSQVWQTMGTGTNGDVNAMVVFNSDLIVAGSFTVAGGQLVNRIARWNGTSWLPLGLGMNDDVYSLISLTDF